MQITLPLSGFCLETRVQSMSCSWWQAPRPSSASTAPRGASGKDELPAKLQLGESPATGDHQAKAAKALVKNQEGQSHSGAKTCMHGVTGGS